MTSARGRHAACAAAALLALVVTVAGGCRHDSSPPTEHPSGPTPESTAGANAQRLKLDAEQVRRAGVRSATPEPAEGAVEIAAFGRVLDPLPLVEALHVVAATRAAAAVASAEYERVTRLRREDQNASQRDLESAHAALEKANADLADAAARLQLGWGAAAESGKAIADDLVAGRVALVRIELPAGVHLTTPPATVTLAVTDDPADRRAARILGRAPNTDPLLQGESHLALLADDRPRPGAVLPATVLRDAAPVAGVALPTEAVVWVDGQPAVYVELGAGEFERRTVRLGPRRDDHVIVTAGVDASTPVVVAGAARLLSAQMLGAEPAAD